MWLAKGRGADRPDIARLCTAISTPFQVEGLKTEPQQGHDAEQPVQINLKIETQRCGVRAR